MLIRSPSLAFRASVVFTAVFATIILVTLLSSVAVTWADRGPGNLSGATIAVDYARDELSEANGAIQVANDGRFADLSARNPTAWLIAIKGSRAFTRGRVPGLALKTVAGFRTAFDPVVLQIPGQPLPLGAAAIKQQTLSSGNVLVAAGGIDPRTLSTAESMRLLLQPRVPFVLIAIAVVSLIAMFVAVPFFMRALAPIGQEAAAIGPHAPGRRLHERLAPTELLPLVRSFNSALDQLELELGRRKRFVIDVAHELRTPLAVVSLQVDSLPEVEGKSDLRRGLQRLTQLVAQMLDLERLSLSGGERSDVNLVEVARDVVADLAPMAIAQAYELSLAEPGAPVMVRGDVHAITRALTNLIGNAIAHAGRDGAINVVVDSDRSIQVADEGPGVPADMRDRLFEPFFRSASSAEGAGLGLHLTREIMTAHGGEVILAPSRRGAAFRLSFPPPPTQT